MAKSEDNHVFNPKKQALPIPAVVALIPLCVMAFMTWSDVREEKGRGVKLELRVNGMEKDMAYLKGDLGARVEEIGKKLDRAVEFIDTMYKTYDFGEPHGQEESNTSPTAKSYP